MTGALCAINHYQFEHTVTVESLSLGNGMLLHKKGMTKLLKYICKSALCSNLQII